MRSYSDHDFKKKSSFRLAWPFFLRPATPVIPQKPTARTLTKEEVRNLFSADLASSQPRTKRSSDL